jgi:hypothetical protein
MGRAFSKANTSVSQNFVSSRCIVLFWSYLDLLVSTRIVKSLTNRSKRFRWTVMFEMNTLFALEYTMFAPTDLLRNWHEHRPSNQDDLDWSVMGEFLCV